MSSTATETTPDILTEADGVATLDRAETTSVPTIEVHDNYGESRQVSRDRYVSNYGVLWQCGDCLSTYVRAGRTVYDVENNLVEPAYRNDVRLSDGTYRRVCESCIENYDTCGECELYVDSTEYNDDADNYLCNHCMEAREGRIPYRNWQRGPHEGDEEEGEYIKPTRTVGCEYEMMGRGHCRHILPEVGIGDDPTARIEVRTPPAKGKAADKFTRHTLKQLLDNGWVAGREAGLHVHVHFPEGSDSREGLPQRRLSPRVRRQRLNPDPEGWSWCVGCNNYHNDYGDSYQWPREEPPAPAEPDPEVTEKNRNRARFIALWYAIEDVAYLFDPNRRNNSYSMQMVNGNRQSMVADALEAAREGRYIGGGDRYVSANLNSMDSYHTIEFRCHGSTDDVDHAVAWVAFVQAVVDLSLVISEDDITRLAGMHRDTRRTALLRNMEEHNVITPKAYEGIARVLLPELELAPA